MKLEYVKPDLEEMELVLEGSFLAAATKTPEVTNPDNPDPGLEEGEGNDF